MASIELWRRERREQVHPLEGSAVNYTCRHRLVSSQKQMLTSEP